MRSFDVFLSEVPQPTLEPLHWPLAKKHGVDVWVLRLDRIHQGWSGNKWYKLFGHLSALSLPLIPARVASFSDLPLASCGGGYSNHLHALACLGNAIGVPTIGVVRGFYPQLTPTLIDCQAWGMQLYFASRHQWKQKHLPCEFLPSVSPELNADKLYWIPEGGGGQDGVNGCRLIGESLIAQMDALFSKPYGHKTPIPVFLACGTGTTATGLIASLDRRFRVEGISVLKGEDLLTGDINAQLALQNKKINHCEWVINTEFHGGGYGKVSSELKAFAKEFERQTTLLLDPIYTLKAFWALSEHIKHKKWRKGSQVVVVHTGGLQGRRGMDWL